MKDFLVKIILFLIVVFLSFFLIFTINKNYNLPKNIKYSTLIIGDSHVGWSILSEYIPNSKNIGSNNESLTLSYYRIKEITENNHNIKKIVLGFGYHSLSTWLDELSFAKRDKKIMPSYFSSLPLTEIYQKKINISSLRHSLFYRYNIYANNSIGINYKREPAGYSRYGIEKRTFNQFYKDSTERPISENLIQSLINIFSLCSKYKIKLYLINTPICHEYHYRIPNKFISLTDSLGRIYSHEYINLSSFPLDSINFDASGDHVMCNGPEIVSKLLSKRIKSKP
jgi:hypothetical protein